MAEIRVNVTASKSQRVNVSSSNIATEISATPDTSQYYSNLAKNWAIAENIVNNEDYSSKHYAKEAQQASELANAYKEATEQAYISFSEQYANAETELTALKDAGVQEINTAVTDGKTEITTTKDLAIDAVNNTKTTILQDIEFVADGEKQEIEDLANLIKDNAEDIANRTSFALFDTVLKDHILTYEESKGLALQGTYVYKDAIAGERYGYPDFYAKCLEEYNEATATETVNGVTVKVHSNGHKFYDIANKSAIDGFFNTMGSAWFYGVDTENERIFLPRNDYFVQLTGDTSKVNNTIEAGLPNVTGNVGVVGGKSGTVYETKTGAFSLSSTTPSAFGASGSGAGPKTVKFDASLSNPIYGNSNTVQPNAVKKLLYICVGNTVSDTSWVDVVTQVANGAKDIEDKRVQSLNDIATARTNIETDRANAIADIERDRKQALTDLTNKENAGLTALANASNALRTTQITNCLLEVPQRIKLELNNGTLTLKAGSVVTVPNGFEADGTTLKFDEIVIENDVTAPAPSVKSLVFYGVESKTLMNRDITLCLSGNSDPASKSSAYYDTSINKVNFYSSSGAKYNVAFPLAIVSGNATSLEQIFNGMGYIGKHMWAEKGIKGLIPNGRNEDGSLKNIEYITKNFIVREVGWGINAPLVCGLADIESKGGSYFYVDYQSDIVYNEEQNFIYKKGVIDKEFLPFITYYAGNEISNFQPKQPFRAVDYNDLQELTTTHSFGNKSGYIKQANGLLIQWGSYLIGGDRQTIEVTLPAPYLSVNSYIALSSDVSVTYSGDVSYGNVGAKPNTANTIKLSNERSNSTVQWMTIGNWK